MYEKDTKKESVNRKFRAMFTQHNAVQLILDLVSGQVLEANPAAVRFYGYTEQELLGLTLYDLSMNPVERIAERMHTIEGGSKFFPLVPHRLKSGEIRFVDVYSCPIVDGKESFCYSIVIDVTEREMLRQELLHEKELLKITLQSIGDGVVTTDNAGRITSLNAIAEEMAGLSSDEAVGLPFADVFVLREEETGLRTENPILKVLKADRRITHSNGIEICSRDGKRTPITDSAAPIRTADGRIQGVVIVLRDVSDQKEYIKQIEFLSYFDPLTKLYNRRYAEKSLERLDTPKNLPISIIVGDVNGLKITNDVFGHKTGDLLLQNIGDILKDACRDYDVVARWGGDEFLIVLPRTDLQDAGKVMAAIQSTPITIGDGSLCLTLSLGCAVKDTAGRNIHSVMREAEEYMYHRKLLDGKNYRNSIIRTLLTTLYKRSNETKEHSLRLARHCQAIARKLGLSTKEIDELSMLSLLHDIGNVSIDPQILQKKEPLLPLEKEEIKRHPEIGYRIAQATQELAVFADLILSHHEHWDGRGYPQNLKGAEIPLACRILAVADAFDAMTNDRVYRPAFDTSTAIRELKANAGTQFDPDITRIFIETIESAHS